TLRYATEDGAAGGGATSRCAAGRSGNARWAVRCFAAPVLAAVAALAASPGIAAAAPATPRAGSGAAGCAQPSGTIVRAVPWAQRLLAPKRVWSLSRGAGVTVAVLDGGVSASAPALAGAVLPGRDVTVPQGRTAPGLASLPAA